MHSAFRVLTLVLTVSAGVAGCTASGRPIRFGDRLGAEPAQPEEVLRARVSNYMFGFINVVESELSEIVLRSRGTPDSAQYREHAIITALRTNDMALQAGFDPDTAAALADTWVLSGQMRDFFRTGEGRDWFTPYQDNLVDALTRLEVEIAQIGNDFLGREYDKNTVDPELLRKEFIDRLIRDNPIHGQGLVRTSASIEVAEFLGRQPQPNLFTAMESIDDNTATISYRLAALTHVMPKAMIWRADLLLNETLNDFERGPLMGQLDRAATAVKELPDVIERERIAAFESIDQQRADTLADFDRQRTETFDAIDRQRVDTIASIETLRAETLNDVDAMRIDTLERVDTTIKDVTTAFREQSRELVVTLDTELDSTLGDALVAAEEMRVAAFVDGKSMLDATLDRFFWRALVLIAAALMGGATLLVIAHRLHMRRLPVSERSS